MKTLFLPFIEKDDEGDCGGDPVVGRSCFGGELWWGAKGVLKSMKRGGH